MDSLVTIVVPGIVAALTAAGATISVPLRDVDAYERRRGVWQWLLVLLAAVAAAGAVNSATGVGRPLAATLMAVLAGAAAVFAHLMWRRLAPDVEPRIQLLATAAAAAAVVVVAAAVTLTYISGKGCRQADELVKASVAHSDLILPTFSADQAPALGEFEDWARELHEQAQRVSDDDIAPRTNRLAELAGQIVDAVRAGDPGQHALLGAQFYDELKVVIADCHPQ